MPVLSNHSPLRGWYHPQPLIHRGGIKTSHKFHTKITIFCGYLLSYTWYDTHTLPFCFCSFHEWCSFARSNYAVIVQTFGAYQSCLGCFQITSHSLVRLPSFHQSAMQMLAHRAFGMWHLSDQSAHRLIWQYNMRWNNCYWQWQYPLYWWPYIMVVMCLKQDIAEQFTQINI